MAYTEEELKKMGKEAAEHHVDQMWSGDQEFDNGTDYLQNLPKESPDLSREEWDRFQEAYSAEIQKQWIEKCIDCLARFGYAVMSPIRQ